MSQLTIFTETNIVRDFFHSEDKQEYIHARQLKQAVDITAMGKAHFPLPT